MVLSAAARRAGQMPKKRPTPALKATARSTAPGFLALRMSVDLLGRPFDPRKKFPRFYSDSIWCFLLNELPGERSRLVVSGYWAFQPRWLRGIVNFFLLEPSTWIMQTRQFKGLKRRAEREARKGMTVAASGSAR